MFKVAAFEVKAGVSSDDRKFPVARFFSKGKLIAALDSYEALSLGTKLRAWCNGGPEMPTSEDGIAAMKAAQALRILETLNAARPVFSVFPPEEGGNWRILATAGEEGIHCEGVTLTDALAQFAQAVGL